MFQLPCRRLQNGQYLFRNNHQFKKLLSGVPKNAEAINDKTKILNDDVLEAVAIPIESKPTLDASRRGSLNSNPCNEKSQKNKTIVYNWIKSPRMENGIIKNYKKLSKFRLTSLVVITTMSGYAMAPCPFDLNSFLLCSIGTGLCSAAANSINQYHEVPFDSQMSRTKNRVLVTGELTPLHAVGFATLAGTAGLSMLYFGVNPLTAFLSAGNLFLYTSIYTPMKRISILNTWIGSIVGAIPPLIGWAGCAGSLDVGAWMLAGVLYAWQFPHFNALSWNLRPDYSRAGYRMMAVTNPKLCRITALRYTGVITILSLLSSYLDVTNIWFALESMPLNLYFGYLAYKFYKKSDSNSSRKLFRFSLIHLPALMLLFLLNKKQWFWGKQLSENKDTATITLEGNESSVRQNPIASVVNILPPAIAAKSDNNEKSPLENLNKIL